MVGLHCWCGLVGLAGLVLFLGFGWRGSAALAWVDFDCFGLISLGPVGSGDLVGLDRLPGCLRSCSLGSFC